MKSLLEEIYDNLFSNAEEIEDLSKYLLSLKQSSEVFMRFKANLSLDQIDDFNEINKMLRENEKDFILNAFKGGFKMGFGLALEILK